MTDHESIRQIIARQAQLRDDDRIEEWAEAFAEDAVFRTERATFEGKPAIVELANSLSTGSWRGVHLLSEPAITVDGDTATAFTDHMYVAPEREKKGFRILSVSRYHDAFARGADGTWRYTERYVQGFPSKV